MYTCDNPECRKRLSWLNSTPTHGGKRRKLRCSCGTGTTITIRPKGRVYNAFAGKPALCKVLDEAKAAVRNR